MLVSCVQVDASGVHVNGEGKYGICAADCSPTVSLAAILAGLGISTNTANTNTAAINTVSKSAKLNTAPASVNFNTHHSYP